MIEQTANPQASVAALKGLGGVSGKGGKAAKAGLFAKFMAAFQAQLKQHSASSTVNPLQKGEAQTAVGKLKTEKSASVATLSANRTLAEAEAKVLIQEKWNKGEHLQAGEAHSTMEALLLSHAGTTGPDHANRDALLAMLHGDQLRGAQHQGANYQRLAEDEQSQVIAGVGEVSARHSRSVNGEKLLVADTASSRGEQAKLSLDGSQVKVVGRSAATQNNATQAALAKDAGDSKVTDAKAAAAAKGASSAIQPGAIQSAVEELTADDWLAANAHNSARRTVNANGAAATGKPSMSEMIAAGGNATDGNGAVAKAGVEGVKTAMAKGGDGANGSKSSTTTHAADPLDTALAGDQTSTKPQSNRPLLHAAESMTRHAQAAAANKHERTELQANPAAQAKGHQASHLQQIQAAQVQAAGAEKGMAASGDSAGGGSQHDLNSGKQHADGLLADGSKADVKGARAADFAAQMHYKTAHVYKPAEAMIEIARSARDGSMKLELQLEPAHLGKVQVTLHSDASKQLQVHIMVDQATSRQVIEQHLPQLRTALAEQGLNLGNFSMNMNSQNGEGGAAQPERAPFSEFASHGSTAEGAQESVTRLGVNTAAHGHLNILV